MPFENTADVMAPLSPRRGRVAAWCVGVAVVLAGCTGGGDGDAASLCQRSNELLDTVASINGGEELPEPIELRELVTGVVDLAGGLDDDVRGADESLAAAFRTVEIAGLEYQRSVEPYGYDLLAARTQGSTDDDERLYSFEHATSVAALDQVSAAAEGWCADG